MNNKSIIELAAVAKYHDFLVSTSKQDGTVIL